MWHTRSANAMATFVFGVTCLLAWPVLSAPPAAPATSDTAAGADLSAMALAAKSHFHPIPGDRVVQARARLEKALKQLSGFLATGTAQNAQRWKKYLRWDELKTELAKNNDNIDLGELGQIAARYYRNYPSLENRRFAEMRAALLEYRTALALSSDSQSGSDICGSARSACKRLKAVPAAAIDGIEPADWPLDRLAGEHGQASELIAAVRSKYWYPNLYAAVSQRMVSAGIGDQITETTDVRDCILGTSLVGTAHMKGSTAANLIDSADRAQIELVLTGTVHSDNVGFNRGVQIFSDGDTQVHATKAIYVDADGISADAAQACCETDSRINCISARSCLIEKVAWHKAGRSKATAEQIGSQHAQAQIAERVDARAQDLLDKARSRFQEKFRKPLLRRDEFPQDIKFRTDANYLEVTWRQANTSQLAAAKRPTPITGDNDVAVQLHESFVSNFSRAMLGGVRLTGEKLVEILKQNKMEVPEALQPSDDKAPWAITFAATDPVSATFADNTIRFAIRGRQFETGETVVKNEMEMSAVYQLEKTPQGAHLTRQGDVSVEYIGTRGRLPSDMIVVRTVMRQKFEALFAPEFVTTGIQLPGRWDKGGQLHLQQMAAQDGWLNLAWIRAGDEPASSNVAKVAQAR